MASRVSKVCAKAQAIGLSHWLFYFGEVMLDSRAFVGGLGQLVKPSDASINVLVRARGVHLKRSFSLSAPVLLSSALRTEAIRWMFSFPDVSI